MQRHHFMAAVSRLLGESADYGESLKGVARLTVPAMADGCIIDLVEDDGTLLRVASEYAHPGAQVLCAAPLRRPRRRLLRRLGLRASIRAPLVVRGRSFGVITLVVNEPRAFGPDDVAMAEDLGRRCAMVVENARLHDQVGRALQSRDEMAALVSYLSRLVSARQGAR